MTFGSGLILAASGAALALAWRAALWATAIAALLAIIWILAVSAWSARRHRADRWTPSPKAMGDEPLSLHYALDRVPTPLIRIDTATAYAINRAARTLFGTDDRILPLPEALTDPATRRWRHEGRDWRVDAVDGTLGERLIVLIDVDAAERAAEDHAAEEMIEILGHELLNGLSPIVSLADSAATAARCGDPSLIDILATLTRRIEGLEAFTRAYRALARLPDPVRRPLRLDQLALDLLLLFKGRHHRLVEMSVDVPGKPIAVVDRDLLTQAIWALLQNGAEAALAAPPPCRVALTVTAEATGTLTVDVRDTGAGVAVADRSRIFRPFHSTKEGGSGVGLSLARRIARAHGGDLVLLDTANTTFRIKIPNAGNSFERD